MIQVVDDNLEKSIGYSNNLSFLKKIFYLLNSKLKYTIKKISNN